MKARTLKRKDRFRQASRWISGYTGKNIIKGYRKHFKVHPLCAAYDLQMLGIEISESRIQQLKKDVENCRKQNDTDGSLKNSKDSRLYNPYPCSNEYFYYIVGYTSGGAPIGITWEEMGPGTFR